MTKMTEQTRGTKKDSCVRVVAFVPNAVHAIIRGQRRGDLQKFLLAAIEEKLAREEAANVIQAVGPEGDKKDA